MALKLSKSLYRSALRTSQVLLYLGRLKFRTVLFSYTLFSEFFLQVIYQDVKNQLGIRSSVSTL